MNEKLQQAISAARNGQKTEAQLLLTEVLQDDPNETQAWFLLSTLVDSKQKKAAYLGKVLTLEPNHEMAHAMLDRLQEEVELAPEAEMEVEPEGLFDESVVEAAAEFDEFAGEAEPTPVVVSANTADFLAQEKGDTLPDWLIEEDGLEFTAEQEPVLEAEDAEDKAADESEIPDWLQDEVPDSWADEEKDAVATAVTSEESSPEKVESALTPKPKSIASDNLQRQQKFLSAVLYALVVTAVVIFLILIYLAWNTFL